MATKLRVDPWDPEYGASIEYGADDEAPSSLELDVEAGGWKPLAGRAPAVLPCCAFVDGVRRIDLRLFAEAGEQTAPAVAGSWAVGIAWARTPPQIGLVRLGRTLAVGGGLDAADLELTIGTQVLRYAFAGVAGLALVDPVLRLQNEMRQAEADLARCVLEADAAALIVLDGPLTYFSSGRALGLVKRQSRSYLDPKHARLLAQLRPGERTPLFSFRGQRLERYSWYLRLTGGRVIDGVMSGIVRLEVSSEVGLDTARELADLSAGVLPRFASVPGRDPRAPQNLYPVGQLEAALRHRLGDPALVRRGLEQQLMMEAAHDRS